MPKKPISELDISACALAVKHHRGVSAPVQTGLDVIFARPDFARLCDLADETVLAGACKTYDSRIALLAVCDELALRCVVYDVTLPWHLHAAGADQMTFPPSPLAARYVEKYSLAALERILDDAFAARRA